MIVVHKAKVTRAGCAKKSGTRIRQPAGSIASCTIDRSTEQHRQSDPDIAGKRLKKC